jgi:sarcosine oxidase, subunit beta
MDSPTYDVAVIGAGVIGATCAYHLARRGLSVVVVEAFPGYAEGSTGLSFASIRAQWADDLNTELSWRSICAYRDFEKSHGIDIGYQPNGYLLLIPAGHWDTQLESVALQRRHGVPVDVLSVAQAQAITPFDGAGIAGATWGNADGQIDPHCAVGAYLNLSQRHGARTLFNFRVDAIEGGSGADWILNAGERIVKASYVVNAAGGWAGELAALAGLKVPVVHSRRNIYASAEGAVTNHVPMTIDVASGVYMRTEGNRLLFAGARPDEVDGYNTAVDWSWMEKLLGIAIERFPWLEDVPLDQKACWAGTYENTPDLTAIVGAHPDAATWVNACGFSGHGVMQAPEIGRLVAQEIVDGAVTGLDLTPLSIRRFDVAQPPESATSLVF